MDGNVNLMRKTLFVGNLNYKTTPGQLRRVFLVHGYHVGRVYFIRDRNTAISLRSAFVTFANEEEVSLVLKASASRMVLNKKTLKIAPSTVRKRPAIATEAITDDAELVPPAMQKVAFCEDILPNIFQYLSVEELIGVEKVCQCWHRVAVKMWSLKTSLRFGQCGYPKKIKMHDFKKVLRRCGRNLVEIDTWGITPSFEIIGIEYIVKYCPKLESLTLDESPLGNEALVKLSNGLLELRKIVLFNCRHFTEKGFTFLFRLCRKLEYIEISENDKLSGECFVNFGPNVRELLLCDCQGISVQGFINISRKCKNLQTLSLEACDCVTALNLARIYTRCEHIKKLNFSDNNQFVVSYTDFKCIELFTCLVDLNLSCNPDLSDWHLQTISECCPKLQRLDISTGPLVTDNGIHQLVRCIELVYLNISNLVLLRGDTMDKLSKRCPLEEIICQGCVAVEVQHFVTLIKNCPLLRLLDVTNCPLVTEWLIDAAQLIVIQNRNLIGPTLRIIMHGTQAAARKEDKRFYHRFLEIDQKD